MLFRTDSANAPSHKVNIPASVEGIMMKAVKATIMIEKIDFMAFGGMFVEQYLCFVQGGIYEKVLTSESNLFSAFRGVKRNLQLVKGCIKRAKSWLYTIILGWLAVRRVQPSLISTTVINGKKQLIF
jgi:hypothetical protein